MKVRILFYFVGVFFGLARCGIVPSNFKSPHDEHMHAEEILASSSANESIPTLENSLSRNTSSSVLVDNHPLNTSEELVFDFHNISDLNHGQHIVAEEDLAAKKLSKGSGRSKKKSHNDSTRFKKASHGKIDHAGMNDTQHHGSIDDHGLEPHPLQTDHKAEDLKIHGSVDNHSLEPHQLQTDLKTGDLKINGSADDRSLEPHHLQTDHKTEDLKINGSVGDHSSEHHHQQTDHKTEDLKIHGLFEDHFLEPHHVQTEHKSEDMKIHGSADNHSLDPLHLEFDHNSTHLGLHGTVEDHFSELTQDSENFFHNDKKVTKDAHAENTTPHFDGESEHSKDFATTFDDTFKIPDHELNNKEDFVNKKIVDERHQEDTEHDANNLNEEFFDLSHSDNLINSAKNLTHNWTNASKETKNGSINNNLSDFPIAVEDVTHDSTNLSQHNLNDLVAAHSNELINSVLDFTNDTDHSNKDQVNDSVVVQSNDLTKSVNEAHKNVSEDLKSVPRNTPEFKNGSHDPPKITESAKELFNHADNTNNLLKSTVASITNSKLFLNIHNSFMRLNPTDKPNSAKLNEDETTENVISVSDDLTTSKINGENLNKQLIMDADSREVNTLALDRQDITSPSSTVSDTSATETENRVKFSSGHTEEILVNPNINNNSESIDKGTDVGNAVENKTSQGLLSSLGLDFLMNSELAKNAASAMEVFNFTDSALTDHIIDDQNDMHDLLDIRSSVVDDHNLSNFEISEQINSNVDADSSTIATDSSKVNTESSTLDIESSSVVYVSDEVSEVSNNFKDTFVKKIDSSLELSAGNGSIEAFTPAISNSTEKLGNVTLVPAVFLNSTVEFEATANTARPDAINESDVVGEVKCPPPGICIFWFFAQDTCTINRHCLGSRICCRIGCSKTCVEI